VSKETQFPSRAKDLVKFTAQKQGALSLADTLKAHDGELTHDTCRTEVDFMVEYRGYWFAVHADQQGTKAVLRVHGIIGNLPFSYQSAFARSNILAVVSAASKEIRGQVRIDDQQRIILIDTVRSEGTLTPKVILAETTKVLLKLKPYLELVTTLQPPEGYIYTPPVDDLALLEAEKST